MRLRPSDIPELPSERHSFHLLPARRLELANGFELTCRQAGTGTPILLLHGLWTSAYTFRSLVDPLAESFRLILPELIDPTGRHLLPDADYRPERLADLAICICDRLELPRVVLVGHAECGLAGLDLAIRCPERLIALVALGPSLRVPVSARLAGWWRGRNGAARWARAGFARPDRAALAMLNHLDYADTAVVSRQELRELARAWTTLPGALTLARILAQTRKASYPQGVMERLQAHMASGRGFEVPLRLVFGQADRKAPPEHGQWLNRLIPGSELLVAERSSGVVQVENPRWTEHIIASAAARPA